MVSVIIVFQYVIILYHASEFVSVVIIDRVARDSHVLMNRYVCHGSMAVKRNIKFSLFLPDTTATIHQYKGKNLFYCIAIPFRAEAPPLIPILCVCNIEGVLYRC